MSARPPRLRVAHLADPHFGCEDEAAADAVVAALKALAPDLTAVAGDLTFEGRSREFVQAQAWLARLPQPQIATAGNHDAPLWNVAARLFAPFGRFNAYVGCPRGEIRLPGLYARALNTARGMQARLDWSKGSIRLDETRRAVADMRAAGDALKILVCHHPLVEPKAAAVSGAVHRGMAAARLLAEGGVDLILTGHVHQPFAFALPWGDGLSLCVGAGTLSRRTRGAPPCFSLIDARPGTIEVTPHEWTGEGFAPARTMVFTRRGAPESRRAGVQNGEVTTLPGPSGR
ncbi:metallophosphoesterase family protein [Methylocella sp.]|uniref:metallophosphoesterase family protein n=1 Tax=Methylocella sp. TaxID=1978226 RepID=UPI003783E56F